MVVSKVSIWVSPRRRWWRLTPLKISRTGVDDLAADQLERFEVLRIYSRSVLEAAGLEVLPTFRTPHVTVAFAHLDMGLEALATLEHELRVNPLP